MWDQALHGDGQWGKWHCQGRLRCPLALGPWLPDATCELRACRPFNQTRAYEALHICGPCQTRTVKTTRAITILDSKTDDRGRTTCYICRLASSIQSIKWGRNAPEPAVYAECTGKVQPISAPLSFCTPRSDALTTEAHKAHWRGQPKSKRHRSTARANKRFVHMRCSREFVDHSMPPSN